ncbi:DUF5712 family protein [Myroides odoratimimus]|uniref:Clindamycin resistance transfer factor BtgB n=1 Tax=Myroides odoratimimus CIP 101113 TaxID=883154 RepID=A0AAV3F6I9_9FLAO|nr:DUF5712 family protein [Myroides odoratimimus]EHO14685.1 hypothetical protein HMPREF9715_00570 [Myroides odoratimimus CIP 101113]
MHIKIQGGGNGKYANSGSCSSLVSYLEHEDLDRIKKGQKVEPFFSHNDDAIKCNAIIEAIDNNKKKLCRDEAKFFMITVSPSQKELQHLGKTTEEQSEKLKDYIRNGVMQQYAENFNKGLNAEDVMYFAKIHHERKTNKEEGNLHIHILVSRKSVDGRLKLSPMTNHQNTKKGAVKGGFVRVDFYTGVEKAFDEKFLYQRQREEQFDFKKQYKKGTAKDWEQLNKEKYQYNQQQKVNRNQFIQNCKEQGFSDKEISQMFQSNSIEKGNESFSIGLTDNSFQLVRFVSSVAQALQYAGSSSQSSEDNRRRKRKRSI